MDEERRPDVRSIGMGNIFFISFRYTLTQSFAQIIKFSRSHNIFTYNIYINFTTFLPLSLLAVPKTKSKGKENLFSSTINHEMANQFLL
jgi:hypothetical protein